MPDSTGSPNIRIPVDIGPTLPRAVTVSRKGRMIFYLIGTGVIDIIGVPHKQMDTPAYFGDVEP